MSDNELTVIPQITRVYKDTTAHLNAMTGVRAESLGYATDTGILYRYSGAAWEAIVTPIQPLPSGFIGIWTGTIANIPTGYVICDGNNSSPNLLAKFIEGVATAITNPGATGGATNKTTAGHTHGSPFGKTAGPVIELDMTQATSGTISNTNYKLTASSQNDNSTPRLVTNSNTDTIADIRPAFYDVAYIMKT
jgi:hypothetical protein